jgi:archaellum component FlaF (FlaF/FlaG flagellin family)
VFGASIGENFEGATFPPAGWTSTATSGACWAGKGTGNNGSGVDSGSSYRLLDYGTGYAGVYSPTYDTTRLAEVGYDFAYRADTRSLIFAFDMMPGTAKSGPYLNWDGGYVLYLNPDATGWEYVRVGGALMQVNMTANVWQRVRIVKVSDTTVRLEVTDMLINTTQVSDPLTQSSLVPDDQMKWETNNSDGNYHLICDVDNVYTALKPVPQVIEENFEGVTFPPADWASTATSGACWAGQGTGNNGSGVDSGSSYKLLDYGAGYAGVYSPIYDPIRLGEVRYDFAYRADARSFIFAFDMMPGTAKSGPYLNWDSGYVMYLNPDATGWEYVRVNRALMQVNMTVNAWQRVRISKEGETKARLEVTDMLTNAKQVSDAFTLSSAVPDDQMKWETNNSDGNYRLICDVDNVYTTLAPVTKAPIFTPAGKYITGLTSITITAPTGGSSIYYTINGPTPTPSSTPYTGAITVNIGDTLSAIAVGADISNVTSVTYCNYNRPGTILSGSATVDGDLSDWAGTTWAPMDQNYDSTAADIAEAYYSARWQANKIYVAVKVRDTAHYLTDIYTGWSARDAIEIYLHTDNTGDVTYPNATTAQQYIVGIMNSDQMSVWTAIGGDAVPTPLNGSNFSGIGLAAGRVVGEWLQYEVAITPYTYLGFLETGDLSTSVMTNLEAGDVIGLDVNAIANNAGTFTGVKSENLMEEKYHNWEQFGLHKLMAQIPGDANGDSMVDVGDLGILAANYGGSDKTWAQGDFNGDKLVDVGDLGILAAHYGEGVNVTLDFSADYTKAFGTTVADETDDDSTAGSSVCSSLGLPLVAGLMLMGLMLVKLEE